MASAISVTLKNYRCFTDIRPATMDFGSGFTAFVGPNNSGKSAYLKFFYEFHNLWQNLLNPGILAQFNNEPVNSFGVGQPRYVVDVQELLSDYTGRPLGVEFRLRTSPAAEPYVDSIVLDSEPGNPSVWRGRVRCAPSQCHRLRV